MKTLVVGLGIQGLKRKKTLNDYYFASVDPINPEADFSNLGEVPIDKFESVFCCVPEHEKIKVVEYCARNLKHLLIEKPLITNLPNDLKKIELNFTEKNIYIQSAYNHRYEPNIIRIKNILDRKIIGEIYTIRIFYGNGTSLLVQKSNWKNESKGVGVDLGSHILDMLYFWFGKFEIDVKMLQKNYETQCADYFSFIGKTNTDMLIACQTSYLSWKNTFHCEITGSLGAIVMNSFCKWSNSVLELRHRTFPSGAPKTDIFNEPYGDMSWQMEQSDFFNKINDKAKADLSRDIFIEKTLHQLKIL